MASSSTTPPLVERGDIHKSCKSIETLLNTLSEYCEAAAVLVSLQKKLAKALKDAAVSKATAEIASNAMMASASVFESLSDVDTKFSKTLDKEYDIISDEVKKSFKKLTKEEKAHDEKMSVSNAKIKQAGQIYEKKSKKRAADANEEHARYINLISTLGPEISQDKFNHAVAMSQRHTTMIYSVAACLARLADLEWQKSCECVRRFSPNIGPLGSLRSLCEGGWTGPIPLDLPDTTHKPVPQAEVNMRLGAINEVAEYHPAPTDVNQGMPNLPSLNGFDTSSSSKRAQISTSPMPVPSLATTDTLQPPHAPFVDSNTGSVRSLSAFPVPPTHFPLPSQQQQQQQQTPLQSAQSSASFLEFPPSSPLADSPISTHDDLSSRETSYAHQSNSAQSSAPPAVEQSYDERHTIAESSEAKLNRVSAKQTATHRPLPHRSQTSLPTESLVHNNRHSPPLRTVEIKPLNVRLHRDSQTSREFGGLSSPTKSRTVENFKYPRSIERTDTGTSTTGSIVAAMRNRYDNNSGSTSPPRDLPRLPLNVNYIAARHQNNEFQRSLDSRINSPPVSRQQSLPLLDAAARQARESYTTSPNNSDEERRRRQREDELVEVSRKQDEQDFKDREIELEARARELDRDRAQLQALRAGGDQKNTGHTREHADGNGTQGTPGLHPQERLHHQLQRPLSKMELDEAYKQPSSSSRVPPTSPSRTQESYTHLLPPPSATNLPQTTFQPIHSPKLSHPPSPLLHSEGHGHVHLQGSSQPSLRSHNNDDDGLSPSYTSTASTSTSIHAPFCGCEKCSISKYRQKPQPRARDQQSSPTESKRSEKSKLGTGWIRRLSMPVSNMSIKKQQQGANSIGVGTYSLGGGIAGGGASNKGAGLFSLDSKRNMSATGLLGVHEDGKLGRPGVGGEAGLGRRSYDLAGMNNRSMTNLKLR